MGAGAGGRGRRRMRLSPAAGGAILAAALAVALFLPAILPFLRLLQYRVADQAVALLSPEAPAHPDVVFIGVTEETLAGMPYRSPIDRAARRLDRAASTTAPVRLFWTSSSTSRASRRRTPGWRGFWPPPRRP